MMFLPQHICNYWSTIWMRRPHKLKKASCSFEEDCKVQSQWQGNRACIRWHKDRRHWDNLLGCRNCGSMLVTPCSNLWSTCGVAWQDWLEFASSGPGKSWRSLDGSEYSQLSQVSSGLHGGVSWIHLLHQFKTWTRNSLVLSEPFSDFWTGSECKPWTHPCPCLEISQIWLWIHTLNFGPICDLYWSVVFATWKVVCLVRKWTLFLFQLPYAWFNLNHISLTKNLSKAKNFKNYRYEWSKNLHCKGVPKWSIAIAGLFVSLGFLVQPWVNFHTHTKRSFVVLGMCESYGILLEKKRL